jgi:hypothetical protein
MEWVTVSYNGKKRAVANHTSHPTYTKHTAYQDIKLSGILLVSKDANDRIIIGLLNNGAKKKWLINNMGITLTTILEEFGSRLDINETHLEGITRVSNELSLGLIDISDIIDNISLHNKSKMIMGIVYIDFNDMIKFQEKFFEKISIIDKTTIPKYCGDMDSLHLIYLENISENLKRVEIYSGQKYSEKYCLTTDIHGNNVWISFKTQGFLIDQEFLEKIHDTINNSNIQCKINI